MKPGTSVIVLKPGTRVTVLGHLAGVVLYTAANGGIAVRIMGETTIHEWHPSQVAV